MDILLLDLYRFDRQLETYVVGLRVTKVKVPQR